MKGFSRLDEASNIPTPSSLDDILSVFEAFNVYFGCDHECERTLAKADDEWHTNSMPSWQSYFHNTAFKLGSTASTCAKNVTRLLSSESIVSELGVLNFGPTPCRGSYRARAKTSPNKCDLAATGFTYSHATVNLYSLLIALRLYHWTMARVPPHHGTSKRCLIDVPLCLYD